MFEIIERLKTNQPVELYEFRQGPNYWRYTPSNQDETYGPDVFLSVAMEGPNISVTGELAKEEIHIILPISSALAQRFMAFPIGAPMTIKVMAFHRGQTDRDVLWEGFYSGCQFVDSGWQAKFQSSLTSRRDQAIHRTASLQCSHELYDPSPFSCNVVRSLFRVGAPVAGISGRIIQSAAFFAFADGYFNAGAIEWLRSDGILESRTIVSHTGDSVLIYAPIPDLPVGQIIDAFPGCNLTTTDCLNKFNNLPRFGGFPFFPDDNPFNGITLF